MAARGYGAGRATALPERGLTRARAGAHRHGRRHGRGRRLDAARRRRLPAGTRRSARRRRPRCSPRRCIARARHRRRLLVGARAVIASAAQLRYRYPDAVARRARRRRRCELRRGRDRVAGRAVRRRQDDAAAGVRRARAALPRRPLRRARRRRRARYAHGGAGGRRPTRPASRSRTPRRRSCTAQCCATSPSASRTTACRADELEPRAAARARPRRRAGTGGSDGRHPVRRRAAARGAGRRARAGAAGAAAGRADRAAGRRGRRGVHGARPGAGRCRHGRADRRAPPRPGRPDRRPRDRGRRRRARGPAGERPPAATGDVLLAARGIDGGRGGARVLHGIDLEVRAGAVVALHGANGTGKTTLLRAAGRARPAARRDASSSHGRDVTARARRGPLSRAGARAAGSRAGSCSATRSRAEVASGRSRTARSTRSWRRSTSPRSPTGTRATSRPASASAWRSPRRWRPIPPCCCWTSRRAAWTRPAGRRWPG